MIDVLEAYKTSLDTILSLGKNICILDLVERSVKDVAYVRLKPQPFELSEEIEYHTRVVTAHKLSQYVNKIHSVQLEEDVETWLDILIADDIANKERIMVK